ncbi:hypothetical protein F4141_22545 [Candidatus Poribacteria bacterium]|nr:hypothetical protein [Candidatus Poribacteria bacterium]
MEITLKALPDQETVPYVQAITNNQQCNSCNQTLTFDESYRIIDNSVLFYREPYFTCGCKQFIWVSFLQSDSEYISDPRELSNLINPETHSKAKVVKVSRADIRFLKEDLKSNNIQPIDNYNSLYKSVITLSMQIQLTFILKPEAFFHVDFWETERTGLSDFINNIIRNSGNLFWLEVKRLLLIESTRLIGNLVDKRTSDTFNLNVLKKKYPNISSLKKLSDEFDCKKGKYYKIRRFRNKWLSHTEAKYKTASEDEPNQKLLAECLEDIIVSVNDISQAMGLTFTIEHIQLDTRTEQRDSLLSVLGKINYALDTERREGENNAGTNNQ